MATKKKQEITLIGGRSLSGTEQAKKDLAVQNTGTSGRTIQSSGTTKSGNTNRGTESLNNSKSYQRSQTTKYGSSTRRTESRRSTSSADTKTENEHRSGTKKASETGASSGLGKINDWLLGTSDNRLVNMGKAAWNQFTGGIAQDLATGLDATVVSNAETSRRMAEDNLRSAQERRSQYLRDVAAGHKKYDEKVVSGYNNTIAQSKKNIEHWNSVQGKAQEYISAFNQNADDMFSSGAERTEEAKQGTSKVGSFLVDAGIAADQMLLDLAAGGGNAMIPMAVRSFGSGAYEARKNGGDVNEQIYEGTKSAAIEWISEKLFAGNPVYDKGSSLAKSAAERLVGKEALERITRSAAARVAKLPTGMLEEGLEEAFSDYANPLVDSVRNRMRGEEWNYAAPERSEVMRDAAIGALLGGVGQVGASAANRLGTRAAAQEAAQTTTAAQRGEDTTAPENAVKRGTEDVTAPEAREAVGNELLGRTEMQGQLDEYVSRDHDDIADIASRASEKTRTAEDDGWRLVDVPDAPDADGMEPVYTDARTTRDRYAPQIIAEDEARLMEQTRDASDRWTLVEERGQRGEDVRMEFEALQREQADLQARWADLNERKRTAEGMQLGEQRAEEGVTSAARGTEENHIDNRRSADMGDRRIKAFQFDHPELHGYFAQAAQDLLEDSGYIHLGRGGYSDMSPAMAEMLDTGISLTEIQKALQAIVDDNGQENYAAAKRVELVLDDMLENGYSTTMKPNTDTGRGVGPNQAYLDAKAGITGGSNEWARTLRAEQNIAAYTGDAVDEAEVARQFIEENPDLAWQVPEEYRPDYHTARDNGPGFIVTETVNAPGESETTANQGADIPPAVPPQDVTLGAQEPGSRPTMPEPTMPMEADGTRRLDWTNRIGEMETPDGDNTRESKTWTSTHDSEVTSEDMASIMETDAFRSAARYVATTNQGNVDSAIARIRRDGYAKSVDDFITDANSGNLGSEIVARGALLLKTANDLGRMRDFADIYIAYKTIGTRAGQTTQAFKIYQKMNNMVDGYAANMTPADQVYLMRKSVAEYNLKLPTKKHLTTEQRATQLTLDEGLVEQYLNAESEDARKDIRKAILRDLGEQAPSSWVEKLDNWRYFAMLFNPRTHFRNVGSNAVSVPVVLLKDKVAQAMEFLLEKSGRMEHGDRTKATLDLRKGSQDRINMAYASSFYDMYLRDDAGSKWYEQGASEIDRNKTIFKRNKLLEWLNGLNSKLLDVEDIAFSRPAFAVAFARECKLQGITGADIEAGRADAGTVQGIIDRAQRYSQEMVFRESGKLANRLADLTSKGGVLGTIINAATPFKRTPANILTRGWQYSPMGLVQGIAQLRHQVDQGKITTAQAIDNIAKGVTGTGLMALGYGLASIGHLTGGGSDDDDQAAFDKLQGRQDFSFKLFDHYISAENFGFEAIPLLVGASLYERLVESADDNTDVTVLDYIEQGWRVLLGMTEPVFETTMLSSVDNIMTDLQYADGDYVGTAFISLTDNYINQFFPTIGGATERTFLENTRQSTYTDQASSGSFDIGGNTFDVSGSLLRGRRNLQYEMGYRFNRIPGVDYNQIPYIDAWGRETSTGSGLERAFNNFINPAATTERQTSEIEAELQRLKDAGKDGVFPQRAKQSVKVNDHYLTADEYVTYQRTYGQTALQGVQEAMASTDWKNLSDDEKADRIRSVYKMATETAKSAVDPDYESSDTSFKLARTLTAAGAGEEASRKLATEISALPGAGSTGNMLTWQKLVSIENSDLPQSVKDAYYRDTIDSDNVWDDWQKAKADGRSMAYWCADHYDSYNAGAQYVVGRKKNAAARGRRDEDRALYRTMIGG